MSVNYTYSQLETTITFFSLISLLAFEANHVHVFYCSRFSWETSFTFISLNTRITLWSNYTFETLATYKETALNVIGAYKTLQKYLVDNNKLNWLCIQIFSTK